MNVALTPEAILAIYTLAMQIKRDISAGLSQSPVTDADVILALEADVARAAGKFDEWLAAHPPKT